MPFDFAGKKILVTGAGRDLGRAIAKAIAAAGGEVYAVGRNRETIESLVKECDNVHPVIVDLSDWETTREELKKLPALHGVVNNAGYMPSFLGVLDVGKEFLTEAVNVTTLAPINVIQVTAKKMTEAGIHGSIVNVSSVGAINAMKTFLDHDFTKAALDMVTKQFALELGPHQIRVNSVNPTWILTNPAIEHLAENPEEAKNVKAITPLRRLAEVREIVEPVMYLLSDHSSMVSGTTHVVDGGMLSNISV